MRVAVIDIGKPGKNLAWAMDKPDVAGEDLDEGVAAIADALRIGAVALGFEAPQFVPLRDDPMALTAGRKGEFGPGQPTRTFSASAGATVLVTSLVVVPYVLTGLRARVVGGFATFDWKRPICEPGEFLLFEAFVTDQRKNTATRHIEDARLAIADFRRGISDPQSFESSVTSPRELLEIRPISTISARRNGAWEDWAGFGTHNGQNKANQRDHLVNLADSIFR